MKLDYKIKISFIGLLLVCSFLPLSLSAATFFLDPVNGSVNGLGSSDSPFGSLQDVINANLVESRRRSGSTIVDRNPGAPIKAGDTLILRPGFHGNVDINGYLNTDFIIIDGQNNSLVRLGSISFKGASYWRIQGTSISPYHRPAYNANPRVSTIVSIDSRSGFGPSSNIEVTDNDIFTFHNISSWSQSDWVNRASSGISVNAENSIIAGNQVRNIRFGITVSSNKAIVRGNEVINFSGDALRGLGDDGLFEYNLVANAFEVDGNHDDGFQSFTHNRNFQPIKRVTLRGNQFYYDLNHPNKSLISAYQGIGCFDGFFDDWVIENNLLYINHWHGITLLGANNARIFNNTLVDAVPDGRLRPWIKIAPRKDSLGGGAGQGNIVRNNLSWITNEGSGITSDHNIDPNSHDIEDLFVAPLSNNFLLKQGSIAINAGSADGAPNIDLRRYSRDSVVDLGTYEFGGVPPREDPDTPTPNPNRGASWMMPAVMLLLDDDTE